MRPKNHSAKSILVGLTAAIAVTSVQAQSNNSLELEEVVVTARKKLENLQDVPATITAISQSMIEKGFFQDVRDVQNVVPNIVFDEVSTGSQNNAAITMRGIGFQDVEKSFDPAVGMMVDGMFLGTANGAIFKTLDVERIEVLRGPQGTLFGKNTIGGLIHVIRQKPTGEAGGRLRLGTGEFGRVGIDAMVNFPEFNNIAVKATMGQESRDGYFDNVADGDTVGEKDFTSYGIAALYAPSDRFSLEYRFDGSEDDSDTVPVINNSSPASVSGSFGIVGTGTNNADSAFGGRFSVNTTTDFGSAFFDMDAHVLTAQYSVNDVMSFKYIGGLQSTEEDVLNNFAGVNLDAALAGDDQFFTGRRIQEYEQSSHEFQLLGSIGDNISYVTGLYLWDAEYDLVQDTFSFLFGPSPGLGVPDQKQTTAHETDSWSIFGEVNYAVNDNLELTFGVRHIEEEKAFCTRFELPTSGGAVLLDTCNPAATDIPAATLTGSDQAAYLAGLDPSDEWDDTIFKLAGRYDLNDSSNIWMSYTTGFKSGGFNGRGSTLNSAATPYEPETVGSLEIGYKSRLADNRVQLNLTYFNTGYDDLQVDANRAVELGTGQETFVTNAASANIQGIEADMIANVTENFTLMGSLGWLDAEYDDFTADIGVGLADNTNLALRRAPDLSYNINGVYNWEVGNGEASVRVNYAWKDDYETLLTNNTFSSIESYGLLDASVNYQWDRYRVSLFGRNLTDEDYFTHVFAVPVTEALWNFGTPREPRVWGVEISADF